MEETKSHLLHDSERVSKNKGQLAFKRLGMLFMLMGAKGIRQLAEAQTKISKNWKAHVAQKQKNNVVKAQKLIAKNWKEHKARSGGSVGTDMHWKQKCYNLFYHNSGFDGNHSCVFHGRGVGGR